MGLQRQDPNSIPTLDQRSCAAPLLDGLLHSADAKDISRMDYMAAKDQFVWRPPSEGMNEPLPCAGHVQDTDLEAITISGRVLLTGRSRGSFPPFPLTGEGLGANMEAGHTTSLALAPSH